MYFLLIINSRNRSEKFYIWKIQKWSVPKNYIDIKGSNIDFCTMLSKDKIHILNLSKEQNIYSFRGRLHWY